MFQIDNATASPTEPTASSQGTPGWFINANPSSGTQATIVTYDWLNNLQDELIAICSAGGVTPSKAVKTQVVQAIINLIGSAGVGYAPDTGTTNALAITLTPVPTALVAGSTARIKVAHANTGASTLNFCNLATKNIINPDGTALSPNQLSAGAIIETTYDGTSFRLLAGSTMLECAGVNSTSTVYAPVVAVSSNATIAGNVTVGGAVNFSADSAFEILVNGGNPLVQFAPSNYLQFVNGTGLTISDSGTTTMTGNVALANALTVNGVGYMQSNVSVAGTLYTVGINATGEVYAPGLSASSDITSTGGSVRAANYLLAGPGYQNPAANLQAGFAAVSGGGWSTYAINQQAGAFGLGGAGLTFATFNYGANACGSINTPDGSTLIYGSSSDYRIKTDVVPLDDATARLMRLKPVSYRHVNARADLAHQSHHGFLAHELQEHIPSAVFGKKDAMKTVTLQRTVTDADGVESFEDYDEIQMDVQSVDYGKVTPLLCAALQEAVGRIEQLEAKIAALTPGVALSVPTTV